MAIWRHQLGSWLRCRVGYGAAMARSEGPGTRIAPVPRPPALEAYAGMWVAVSDGAVVAAAPTSHRLALTLHDMDHRKRHRVVVQYVRPATDAYIVGVG
jgi:hypothetical protein